MMKYCMIGKKSLVVVAASASIALFASGCGKRPTHPGNNQNPTPPPAAEPTPPSALPPIVVPGPPYSRTTIINPPAQTVCPGPTTIVQQSVPNTDPAPAPAATDAPVNQGNSLDHLDPFQSIEPSNPAVTQLRQQFGRTHSETQSALSDFYSEMFSETSRSTDASTCTRREAALNQLKEEIRISTLLVQEHFSPTLLLNSGMVMTTIIDTRSYHRAEAKRLLRIEEHTASICGTDESSARQNLEIIVAETGLLSQIFGQFRQAIEASQPEDGVYRTSEQNVRICTIYNPMEVMLDSLNIAFGERAASAPSNQIPGRLRIPGSIRRDWIAAVDAYDVIDNRISDLVESSEFDVSSCGTVRIEDPYSESRPAPVPPAAPQGPSSGATPPSNSASPVVTNPAAAGTQAPRPPVGRIEPPVQDPSEAGAVAEPGDAQR